MTVVSYADEFQALTGQPAQSCEQVWKVLSSSVDPKQQVLAVQFERAVKNEIALRCSEPVPNPSVHDLFANISIH